ncbi:MAG: hypothetical protein ABIJ34_07140 [archaeon]
MARRHLDILSYLSYLEERTTATALVNRLSVHLDCSKSALWNSIRELRKCSLIVCGNSSTKGTAIKLTEYGYLVANSIRGEKNEH